MNTEKYKKMKMGVFPKSDDPKYYKKTNLKTSATPDNKIEIGKEGIPLYGLLNMPSNKFFKDGVSISQKLNSVYLSMLQLIDQIQGFHSKNLISGRLEFKHFVIRRLDDKDYVKLSSSAFDKLNESSE